MAFYGLVWLLTAVVAPLIIQVERRNVAFPDLPAKGWQWVSFAGTLGWHWYCIACIWKDAQVSYSNYISDFAGAQLCCSTTSEVAVQNKWPFVGIVTLATTVPPT